MTDQTIQMENIMTLDKLLKENRLAANLSVDEVALKLNLKSSVILDIENNLEQIIADNTYSAIYLRGYLANYSKVVGLPDIKSYPEYQQLTHPEKQVTTLKSPNILRAKKKSSKKIIWVILLLLVISIAGLVHFGKLSTVFAVATAKIKTANIEMRLPEYSDDNVSISGTEGEQSINSIEPVTETAVKVETETEIEP